MEGEDQQAPGIKGGHQRRDHAQPEGIEPPSGIGGEGGFELVGARGVPVIKVRVASFPVNEGQPLPIMARPPQVESKAPPEPLPEPPRSLRNETRAEPPQIGPLVYSLECGEPNFREPEKGEWVVGLYREDDGTPVPLLLWADPKVDLFWDASLREHVMPPRLYLKLDKQPQIDAATGYPVIQGAVCPF